MAYGAKYIYSGYDQLGKYFKLTIAQKDYVGSSSNIASAAPSPISVLYEGQGGTKFAGVSGKCITGSSLSFTLTVANSTEAAAFQLFSIADEDEYKVTLQYGDSPASLSDRWSGLLLPEVYEYPHDGYPYFITITATDGIGRLSGLDFLQSDGVTRYTARNTIMYFFYEIMGKLDIDREVEEIVNVYSGQMSTDSTDSPLMQATVDPTKYLNNEGRENESVWNCLDVLNDMLTPFLVRVRQGNNSQWSIFHVPEMAANSTYKRILTAYDTVDSVFLDGTHRKHNTLATAENPLRLINRSTIKQDWRWKRVIIRQYPGSGGNFVFNENLSPAYWVSETQLKYWYSENRGPSVDATVKYGAVTPFPAVPLYQRVEIFEQVDYQAGVFVKGSPEDSTIYTFLADQTFNDLIIGTGTLDEIFSINDAVFLTKENAAVMPLGIGDNRIYYIQGFTDGDFRYARLKASAGDTSFIDLTSDGSGTRYIGFADSQELTYAVQINGYQTTMYTTGDITNKNGIKTEWINVLAGGSNSLSLAFFWKIIFDNDDTYQSSSAEGYYQVIITAFDGTKYYLNKAAHTWQTTAIANILEDDLKAYEWRRERIDEIEIPVDGRLELQIFQVSSASNTETLGIQIANIESNFIIDGDTDIEYIEKVAEVGENYSYDVEPIEMRTGDFPSSTFKGHIAVGGALATNWFRRGLSEEKELTDIMLQGILNNYGTKTISVVGTLYGPFGINDVFRDTNLTYNDGSGNVTPLLMITGGEWLVRDGVWNAEFKEIRE